MSIEQDRLEPAPRPAEGFARGLFVRSAIILSFLMFLAMVALITHRWMVIERPTSKLVITGTEYLEGATVHLRGLNRPELEPQAFLAENKYQVTYWLTAGSFTIEVISPDGEILFAHTGSLPEEMIQEYNLRGLDPDYEPVEPADGRG